MSWNKDLNKHIAEQTNLYSVQKDEKSIATIEDEIQQFVGIHMLMLLVDLPSYMMYYWVTETWYPNFQRQAYKPVEKLRQYLHMSDNSKINDAENKKSKLYNIQLVIDHLEGNCRSIKPEMENSTDEQIIPARTKYSGIRQYNLKKPVKWDFKIFVHSGSLGIMYDFFITVGKQSGEKCTGSYAVLKLIKALPQQKNYKLFFGNWFCCLALFRAVRNGISYMSDYQIG